MPSWNIHIAQTEQLLEGGGSVARAVRDRNAFLFGNLVPDIFVGYMIPHVDDPIPYRITHWAKPEHIPRPREREFWDTCVVPLLDAVTDARGNQGEQGEGTAPVAVPLSTLSGERERLNRVHYPQRYEGEDPLPPDERPSDANPSPADVAQSLLDLTLGAWAHLLADNVWNNHVHAYLEKTGDVPGDALRVRKQGDFDWFGRTLTIDAIPRATERLLQAAELFPQYAIERRYTYETVGVAHEIVRSNGMVAAGQPASATAAADASTELTAAGQAGHPPYRLLTDEFFSTTFAEVLATTERLVQERL